MKVEMKTQCACGFVQTSGTTEAFCDNCCSCTDYEISKPARTADDYVKDIKDQIRDHPRFELNAEPDPSDNARFDTTEADRISEGIRKIATSHPYRYEKATDTQIGGSHYKNMPIQPVKFITANDLGFCEGNVVKYICRYKEKGQVEDLQKAKHYIDLLIESME